MTRAMTTTILAAFLAAVATGFAVGTQGSFTSRASGYVDPLRVSFFVHIGGTLAAGMLLGMVALRMGPAFGAVGYSGPVVLYTFIAGTLGVFIIMGVAFSFPTIGLTAGQAAFLLGQMLVAVLVDSLGLAGREGIPLDARRIAGLLLLVVAAWLLLPRE